jgi:hypothetical protein
LSIQTSNLIDVPSLIGDTLDDKNITLANNDDTAYDNNDDVEDIVQSLNDNQRHIFGQICAAV